jgi:sporulation protein YlmC with PRC-barrel domain
MKNMSKKIIILVNGEKIGEIDNVNIDSDFEDNDIQTIKYIDGKIKYDKADIYRAFNASQK